MIAGLTGSVEILPKCCKLLNFVFENQLFYIYYSYNRLFWTSNSWFSKEKSHIWKNSTVFHILVIFQQILVVLQSKFSKLVVFMWIYWYKNSKLNKRFNFLRRFLMLKQKSISLYNLWFKNGGLTPGRGIEWFLGPQDAVEEWW